MLGEVVGGRWSALVDRQIKISGLPPRGRWCRVGAEFRFGQGDMVLLDGEAAEAFGFQNPAIRFGALIQEDGEDGVLAVGAAGRALGCGGIFIQSHFGPVVQKRNHFWIGYIEAADAGVADGEGQDGGGLRVGS